MTSGIAFNIGEETAELVAEPILLAIAFLIVGDRAIGMLLVFVNRRGDSGLLCEADIVPADAAVMFKPGAMSV